MTFATPALLAGLLLVPLVVLALVLARRRRARYAVRYPALDVLAGAVSGGSRWRRHLPAALFLLALTALLLGRATYEAFAEAWPSREGEFADKFNSMPKYVVSSTLQNPSWTNTTVLGGDLAAEVTALKNRTTGDVVVHGSATLVHALVDQSLVDEIRLMVFPILLGSGRKLFGQTGAPVTLRLVSATPLGPDGVLLLIYQR
jgi:dihydrofolate reductase